MNTNDLEWSEWQNEEVSVPAPLDPNKSHVGGTKILHTKVHKKTLQQKSIRTTRLPDGSFYEDVKWTTIPSVDMEN